MKLVLISLLLYNYCTAIVVNKGRLNELTLDEKGFTNVKNMHYNWYMYSIKALLAQLGKGLLKEISIDNRKVFIRCLARIREKKEIAQSANCISAAKQRSLLEPKPRKIPYVKSKKPVTINFMLRRRKRSPYRLVLDKEKKTFQVKSMDHAPDLLESTTRSPVKKLTNLFLTMFTDTNSTYVPKKWSKTYKKMIKMQQRLEKDEMSPAARVYRLRMHDLVLDRDDGQQLSIDTIQSVVFCFSDSPLLQDVFQLSKSLGIQAGGTARVLSPRFAPVVPMKTAHRGFLSPAVLPFYKDDSEDQILPIPDLLDKAGMGTSDKESVLQMIMELSGARKTVQSAMKVLKYMQSFGIGDELIQATEKLSATFKELRKTFKKTQKKSLESRGFTLLEPEQMLRMHNSQGLRDYVGNEQDAYGNFTRLEREEALWKTVEQIAEGHIGKRRVRRQLVFTPISVLSPVVLRPYGFAPVFGFSVLGPVVLSPNIFSPLILNPSVLGPWVLSPSVPLPFILSPYLLSPYVLSPLVMAPFILNPYVLSPNVINPYVLSPLVLSPLVLCPDLLSPMVLGGPILSPAVASPAVLSKSVLMAAVLSPSVLS